jgi:cytochrome c-type biogenesis protein CcmH
LTFLLLAALAIAIAAFFTLRPLLGSNPERARIQKQLDALDDLIEELDPEDYAKRRRKLRQALSEAGGSSSGPKGVVIGLGIAVPVATFLMYQLVGTPEGLTPSDDPVTQLRADLVELAHSLERNPNNPEGWAELGMAYKNIQEFSSAQHALRRSLYIDGTNNFVAVELAETLMFMGNRNGLPAESRQLLTEVLRQEPDNQKAMWLMGIGAFQAGNFERAIVWWERLIPLLDPNTSVYNSVAGQIAQAKVALGQDPGDLPAPRQAPPLRPGQDTLPPGHPPTMPATPPTQTAGPLPPGVTAMPPGHPTMDQGQTRPGPVDPAAALPPGHPSMADAATAPQPPSPPDTSAPAPAGGPTFGVELDIDPALKAELSGNETVFVVARAAAGPPTPLAVRRMTVADLPTRFGLSDGDAMVDGMNISTFPEIVITARVSMSGGVTAQPGDLQGDSGPVSVMEVPGTQITISERL